MQRQDIYNFSQKADTFPSDAPSADTPALQSLVPTSTMFPNDERSARIHNGHYTSIADPRFTQYELQFSRGLAAVLGDVLGLCVVLSTSARHLTGQKRMDGGSRLRRTRPTDVEMVAGRFVSFPKADSRGFGGVVIGGIAIL